MGHKMHINKHLYLRKHEFSRKQSKRLNENYPYIRRIMTKTT